MVTDGEKLILFVLTLYTTKFLLKIVLIDVFKVDKKPYHMEFVNNKHQKINMIVVAFIIINLLLFYYLQHLNIISQMLFLGLCFVHLAIPLFIEAFLWWKEDNESRYFVLCIGDELLFITFGIVIWQFGIFGLTTI
ncbi:DUF4181 domain-containing protein [Cytobacillus luteolus]|nr:DUF4181 domain-containing protein [Cytobacillus luteolus]